MPRFLTTIHLPRTSLSSSHIGSAYSIDYGLYSALWRLTGDDGEAGLPQHNQQRDNTNASQWNIPEPKDRWAHFRGKDRPRVPGVLESLRAIISSSWLNVFLIFIPIAWTAHFQINNWKNDSLTIFALCFVSTISLNSLFDFGGEQMALYCGKDIGDLLVVTLNNAVEAALAIILLAKCQLKLLQSTIAGVVLLHLLFVPGVAFITGGARIWQQNLQPRATQLNHTLLMIGVFALLIPAAFFSALNPGVSTNNFVSGGNTTFAGAGTEPFLTDTLRANFLTISRGLSVILLVVYLCSRIFLYHPPGDKKQNVSPGVLEEHSRVERNLARDVPKVNPWVCLVLLISTVAIMAATAEFLVSSIEIVRTEGHLTSEWFGIILLPLASFSGDAMVAVVYFIRRVFGNSPEAPESLAKGLAIDLSIQFTLFWMPFLVLLGWCLGKPLTLLFDLYEVCLLIGASFLVNYVTADSKTNWAEGVTLCAFYCMIALVSWFYKGQIEVAELLQCESVAAAVKTIVNGGTFGE